MNLWAKLVQTTIKDMNPLKKILLLLWFFLDFSCTNQDNGKQMLKQAWSIDQGTLIDRPM